MTARHDAPLRVGVTAEDPAVVTLDAVLAGIVGSACSPALLPDPHVLLHAHGEQERVFQEEETEGVVLGQIRLVRRSVRRRDVSYDKLVVTPKTSAVT